MSQLLTLLLKCPEDLPANQFYDSIGYTKILVEAADNLKPIRNGYI